MKVRPYREQDFPEVCHVYLDAKRDELNGEQHVVAITPLEDDPVIKAAFFTSEVLVLEHSGAVGGFLAFDGEVLRALFVHSDFRGAGAGTALMTNFLNSGVTQVEVNVAQSNVRARRFYEKLGFQVVGAVTREYGGSAIAYLNLKWSAACQR